MSSLRPYRVTVMRPDGRPRLETIDAKDWPTAFAKALEQYGGNARFRVASYYTVMSNGEESRIVNEMDEENLAAARTHMLPGSRRRSALAST
jgi:hypothetical protein